jgi:hypothetical protein
MKIKYLIDNLISPNIQALDFVDRYASVVKTINISIGDSVKRYPIACDVTEQDCANNGRYQDLVPDDSKMSVLYWEELQPMQVSGFTPTKTFKNRVFKGSARLIVWLIWLRWGKRHAQRHRGFIRTRKGYNSKHTDYKRSFPK